MELFSDLFASLADNPDKTFGIGGGGIVFIISQFISVMRGRNKVDIAQADSETTQAEQETEQLKIQTAATIELAKTVTTIVEQQGANTAAQKEVALILQSTVASLDRVEVGMKEVVSVMRNIDTNTGDESENIRLLKELVKEVKGIKSDLARYNEYGLEMGKRIEVVETKVERVLDIEKREKSEQPIYTDPGGQSSAQTFTPPKSPAKITSEQKTIGSTTQPIESPIEEKKEDKSNGES